MDVPLIVCLRRRGIALALLQGKDTQLWSVLSCGMGWLLCGPTHLKGRLIPDRRRYLPWSQWGEQQQPEEHTATLENIHAARERQAKDYNQRRSARLQPTGTRQGTW